MPSGESNGLNENKSECAKSRLRQFTLHFTIILIHKHLNSQ